MECENIKREDIETNDVFISWTSTDEELKNTIVNHLKSQNLTVLDSSCDCAGDFREWSDEAAQSCMVFVSLYTENTIGKQYVEVEITSLQQLDDWRNRCVPVVSDLQMFKEQWPQLAESESAVVLNGRTITESHLKEIQHKVEILLRKRMVDLYRRTTLAPYMRLVLPKAADEEVKYDNLYVPRCCVQEDNGEVVQDAELIRPKSGTVWYLQGAGGSGKSSYIHQLRRAADKDTLLMALPCRKLVGASDLLTVMYDELTQRIGVRDFYSLGAFRSALKAYHLCLVLDGMDEIANAHETRAMVELVRTYYEANAKTTTLLFTGRNLDDADYLAMNGQHPKIVSLRPLQEEQMQTLGGNLMSAYHHKDKSAEFFTNVRKMPQDIRTNPLLMTYLARIFVDKEQTMPRTVVEIFDKVMELTLFSEQKVVTVPHEYRAMMSVLPDILAAFAAERYRLLSEGKNKTSAQILARVLKTWYPDDVSIKKRAEFLTDYLRDRGILVDDEFSHKMQLEYFTAKHYYHRCFDEYDYLVGVEALGELFSHYADPYWAVVLEMFLSKADVIVDADNARLLYEQVTGTGITEFTLLFDVCRKLVCHREVAQQTLVRHVLQQSAVGTFPPYGPLFWYVPEYDLYADTLAALATLTEEGCYTAALALVRDVCWIFGRYNTAAEVSATVKGADLLKKASLTGVRKGLCELFYGGATAETGGEDVYPRCFNLAEAKEWKEKGCGVWGRMTTPFADELGLYAHEMYSELGDDYIGIVADAYCPAQLEDRLPRKSCQKLSGLFFSNGEETAVSRLAINDAHVKAVYYPENMQERVVGIRETRQELCRYAQVLQGTIGYFYDQVVVPAHVAGIPHHAFKGYDSLKKVENCPRKYVCEYLGVTEDCELAYRPYPGTIVNGTLMISEGTFAIEDYACAHLSDVVRVNIPSDVTKIGTSAFWDCRSLREIHLPDSVTEIGESAFRECTSLQEIHLPDSLTEIKDEAFTDCVSLSEIHIPDSVTTIAAGVFAHCVSLSEIHIPNGVTEIRAAAFDECDSLREIHLPDSLTTIGWVAFNNCTSLTSIHLPDSVTEIGDSAFSGCTSLTSIHIPDSMTKIGWGAFSGCTALTSIRLPDSVTEIGGCAFEGCTSLHEIRLPDSVTKIGERAFWGCTSLTTIHLPDGVTTIEEMTFSACVSLASIHLPDSVTTIGKRAFADCRSLQEIYLPDSVTEIGEHALEGCDSLTSIRLPDSLTTIGKWPFWFCRSLKRIENCPREYSCFDFGIAEDCVLVYRPYPGTIVEGTLVIPKGTVTIEDYACAHLSDVVCVKIPDGVTEIGDSAFEDCDSLHEIHIPDSVTTIGERTFSACVSLASIHLPDSVTKIGMRAFAGCRSLTTIHLPDSVTTIGGYAFAGCDSLRAIHLPDSVTTIGGWAFADCDSLHEIHLPDGVTEIGERAFWGCTSLTSVHIPDSVTEIGACAFDGCTSLREIHIPDGVTTVEGNAFSGCASLTSVYISEGVTKIGEHAFYKCTSLTTIHIPDSVTEIGGGAFYGCTSLVSVHLPDGVTEIGWGAFGGCTSLQEIRLPDGVTEIGRNTFRGCTSLQEIHIPDSVTEIGWDAFDHCTSLQEIHIPDMVTHIERGTFSGCTSLATITIPFGVREVDDDAFGNCTGLREITLSRRFEGRLSDMFPDVDLSKVTIHWL